MLGALLSLLAHVALTILVFVLALKPVGRGLAFLTLNVMLYCIVSLMDMTEKFPDTKIANHVKMFRKDNKINQNILLSQLCLILVKLPSFLPVSLGENTVDSLSVSSTLIF